MPFLPVSIWPHCQEGSSIKDIMFSVRLFLPHPGPAHTPLSLLATPVPAPPSQQHAGAADCACLTPPLFLRGEDGTCAVHQCQAYGGISGALWPPQSSHTATGMSHQCLCAGILVPTRSVCVMGHLPSPLLEGRKGVRGAWAYIPTHETCL